MCGSSVVKKLLVAAVLLGVGAMGGAYGSKFISGSAGSASSDADQEESYNAGKTITATVNGMNVYKEDVLASMKKLSVKEDEMEKVYSIVLSQMVTDKLLEAKMKEAKIEEDAVYQEKFKELKNQLRKTMFFEKLIAENIKEDQLKKEYDVIKAENSGKKEAHARHILVKTEEEAKQVINDLDKGASFAGLAKERSSDVTAKNGGDVGFFAEGEILPEFSKAAFALKPGQYTREPVKTALGYHVIYLEGTRDRKVPDYEDVKTNIRNNLAQKMVFSMVRDMRKDADVKMYDIKGELIKEVADAPAPAAEGAPVEAAPQPAPAAK